MNEIPAAMLALLTGVLTGILIYHAAERWWPR